MIAIQIISDLHLEAPKAYDIFEISPKAPYLALLGDIGQVGAETHRGEMLQFLTRQLHNFRAVLFVPGNHETYDSKWPATLSALREYEKNIASRRKEDASLGLFVLMDRASFRLPSSTTAGADVVILGCSLFSFVPPKETTTIEMGINDFYCTGDWGVQEHNIAHKRDVAWLNEHVALANQDPGVSDIVILTHWSPSRDERALNPTHTQSTISAAFSTDLSQEDCWKAEKLKIWACGHTHFNFDFLVERGICQGPLRVVSNQRGYYFQQAAGFDEEKVVKI